MSDHENDQQAVYRIRLADVLDEGWSTGFDGMEVTVQSNGDTS